MSEDPILHHSLFGDLRPLPKPFKSPRTESRPKHLVWIGKEKGRRCIDCGHEGPLQEFTTSQSKPDGVQAICKKCNSQRGKKWQSENRDRKAEYDVSYYEDHREDKLAYRSDRRRQNREHWAAHEPAGSKRCPSCDTKKDVSDFYRNASNDDGLQVYCKPCDNAREKERGRGARKHWRTLIKRQGWVCNPLGSKPGCGRPLTELNRGEVDHIIPRSKGGSDDISNLQVLCAACNRKWSNNVPNKRTRGGWS